jgi:hypothetical protein
MVHKLRMEGYLGRLHGTPRLKPGRRGPRRRTVFNGVLYEETTVRIVGN